MALYMRNGSLLGVRNLDGTLALRECCCDGKPVACLSAECSLWYTFSVVVPSISGASGVHSLGVYHTASGQAVVQQSSLWAPENWAIDTAWTYLISRSGCDGNTEARRNGQANILFNVRNSCTLKLTVDDTRQFSSPAWSATLSAYLTVYSIAANTVLEVAGQRIVADGQYLLDSATKTNQNSYNGSWILNAYAR
jgi:hypothetical protein